MKKGELSITVIVSIIIALIVLIVLVIAFREQIAKLFSTFSNLIGGTAETAEQIDVGSILK